MKQIKLVTDSACDFSPELDFGDRFTRLPLAIHVGDREFIDDESLDIQDLLSAMKATSDGPKTASPSPGDFLKEFAGEDRVFVVTVSSQLSGSYSNALLAARLAMEENLARFIHVFDSKTASIGQTLVNLKVAELIRKNCAEAEIVEKVTEYINGLRTYCLLESLDNLVKSGRVAKLVAKLGSMLSIRLILTRNHEGSIELADKVRGAKRALKRLLDMIAETGDKFEGKVCGIAHVNCREKAEQLRTEILKRFRFKDVIIVQGSGITTVYGDEGGLVLAF